MASSSAGAGIPPNYGTLSNAAAQAPTLNTGASKVPTVEQIARLPPVQNDSESTVYSIFALLGAASLIPWNATITALPYFVSRMGDSPLQNTYASSLVVLYQSARWPTLIHATLTTSSASKTFRIRWSGISLSILLFSIAVFAFIPSTPESYYGFSFTNATLQSVICVYLSTSVTALASFFGPLAIQHVMTGQAAVAVVISIAQLFSAILAIGAKETIKEEQKSQAIGMGSADTSAAIFFSISTFIMVCALLAHWYLRRMPIYGEVVGSFETHVRDRLEEEEALLPPEAREAHETEPSSPAKVLRIARKNLPYNFAILFNFFVTLSVFPAITSTIRPVQLNSDFLSNPLIFSAIHFLVFNLGDWVGRYLCRFAALQVWAASQLVTLSFLRIFFIPLLLACNVVPPKSFPLSSPSLPLIAKPIIASDACFLLILLLFGISNGHVGSSCMMAAPSLEHNRRLRREEVDSAAVVASFCLTAGLLLGGAGSFLVAALVGE